MPANLINYHRLILCGPLWPSVISIPGSSFCAQKLEPGMLKKKVSGQTAKKVCCRSMYSIVIIFILNIKESIFQ
jgi:hypothetical protein